MGGFRLGHEAADLGLRRHNPEGAFAGGDDGGSGIGKGKHLPQLRFAIQMEEVRTFPHIALAMTAGGQNAGKLPVQSFRAFMEQHVRAAVLSPVDGHG